MDSAVLLSRYVCADIQFSQREEDLARLKSQSGVLLSRYVCADIQFSRREEDLARLKSQSGELGGKK